MLIEKEKLFSIANLASVDALQAMNNQQYEDYCKALKAFVQSFPTLETMMKNAIKDKTYDQFAATLTKLRNLLKLIKADGLALSCQRLADELGGQKYNIVEAHLTYLLAEISALSIDIQVAQHEIQKPAPKTEQAPKVTQEATPESDEEREKIILGVDDMSVLLLNLKSMFQNTQYKFVGVTSGTAALLYVEKHTPDLFILDIEMPDMSGYELTVQLRKRGQNAPIIFLTGNATVDYVQKAMALGVSDFVVKPVNAVHVMDKVRKHLG